MRDLDDMIDRVSGSFADGDFYPFVAMRRKDCDYFLKANWEDGDEQVKDIMFMRFFSLAHEIDEYYAAFESYAADTSHPDYIQDKTADLQPDSCRREALIFMHGTLEGIEFAVKEILRDEAGKRYLSEERERSNKGIGLVTEILDLRKRLRDFYPEQAKDSAVNTLKKFWGDDYENKCVRLMA